MSAANLQDPLGICFVNRIIWVRAFGMGFELISVSYKQHDEKEYRAMKPKSHDPYNKFKGFIRGKGLKYEEIGKLLGVSTTTVSQKINGNSDFYLNEIEKIINEYGATRDIFL